MRRLDDDRASVLGFLGMLGIAVSPVLLSEYFARKWRDEERAYTEFQKHVKKKKKRKAS